MNHEKELVVSQFGSNAKNYVKSKGHSKGADLAFLTEVAADYAGEKALDIATGGGHVANKLAGLFGEVVAFDLTPQMLLYAEEFIKSNGHENVSFVQGEAEKLPFLDEAFNLVTCRIAPHHFTDVQSFVNESARVLKKDGAFIVVDNVAPESDAYDTFYNEVEKKRDPSHKRAYKKTEWFKMLEGAGFTIELMTCFPKTFLFDDWCEMMKVPLNDKQELIEKMLRASSELKTFFHIQTDGKSIQSFQAESVLIVAKK